MVLYVNEQGEIKDVGTTENDSLTKLVISDENNPFEGWSTARLLCYKVEVQDGQVIMFTPYIDSRIVEQLDKQGVMVDATSQQLTEAQMALLDNYIETETAKEQLAEGLEQVTQAQMAILEIYDLILGGGE